MNLPNNNVQITYASEILPTLPRKNLLSHEPATQTTIVLSLRYTQWPRDIQRTK